MRIATFNVENLFDRAKIMNLKDWSDGEEVLENFADLTSLLEKTTYSDVDKDRMAILLESLGLRRSDKSRFVVLRRNRGKLVKRPKTGRMQVVADGRKDWIGWLELRQGPMNEIGVQNTGRVIRDLNADILAVIEAEDRIALKEFGRQVLSNVGGNPYPNVMVIDGNDGRGIDVGLMSKAGFEITTMRSHVHDLNSNGKPIFSRDCPEYLVETSNGNEIWFLINHFKSQGYGRKSDNDARRKRQAQAVAQYYQRLVDEGYSNIVILGDLNDKPGSDPLKPLLTATDLKDVSDHSTFDTGEFAGKGTYGLGSKLINL